MKLPVPLLEKKADYFRHQYGFGNNAPIDLKELVSNRLDVLTVFQPLNSDFSGMVTKVGNNSDFSRYILINSNHTIGKQNFTICHELYHLFFQNNFTFQVCYTGKFAAQNDPEEYNADVFASFLLLPESGILEFIPDDELSGINKISLKTILQIEQHFKSSRAALLYRLRKSKIIDSNEYDKFSSNVGKGAQQHGYEDKIYKEGKQKEVWGNYERISRELFESGKISESYYHSLLFDIGRDISL